VGLCTHTYTHTLFLSPFSLSLFLICPAGESQIINRILELWGKHYYDQNPNGPFRDADAAYILAYALIMLHVDHHNRIVPVRTPSRIYYYILCEGTRTGRRKNTCRYSVEHSYKRMHSAKYFRYQLFEGWPHSLSCRRR
jgi:hypothetical protein